MRFRNRLRIYDFPYKVRFEIWFRAHEVFFFINFEIYLLVKLWIVVILCFIELISVATLKASRERKLTSEDRLFFFETTRWRIHVSQRNYIIVFVDDVVEVLLLLILLTKAMSLTRSNIFPAFQIVEKTVVIIVDVRVIVVNFHWRCVRRYCILISRDSKVWLRNKVISWVLIIVVATWDDDEIREIDEELIFIRSSFLIVAIDEAKFLSIVYVILVEFDVASDMNFLDSWIENAILISSIIVD